MPHAIYRVFTVLLPLLDAQTPAALVGVKSCSAVEAQRLLRCRQTRQLHAQLSRHFLQHRLLLLQQSVESRNTIPVLHDNQILTFDLP